MTKTEQTLLTRLRAENDRGNYPYTVVEDTQGARRSWRSGGGRESGRPKKTEQTAWERLISEGAVVKCPDGGYCVPGHPQLTKVAAEVCLARSARHVEARRQELERAELEYQRDQEFVRLYGWNK